MLPRPATDSERNARVWEDPAGTLVGLALVWPPTYSVYLLVSPTHDPARGGNQALLEQLLAWLVQRAREIARARHEPVTLQARPRDRDVAFVTLLERHGFVRKDASTLKYRRSLADPISGPAPPTDFVIRQVRGEEEADACAALHREAFGTPYMQAADRVAVMRDPDYLAELDLVAVAPDGALAAFVRGGIDREESRYTGVLTGYTDPVGTRGAFRNLGLARALLCEAFRRLRDRGVRVACVATGSWNIPMQRLAESVGYELDHQVLTYARTFS